MEPRRTRFQIKVVVVVAVTFIALLAGLQVHFYGSMGNSKSMSSVFQALAKHTGLSASVISDTIDSLKSGGASARVGPLQVSVRHQASEDYVADIVPVDGCRLSAELESAGEERVRVRVICSGGVWGKGNGGGDAVAMNLDAGAEEDIEADVEEEEEAPEEQSPPPPSPAPSPPPPSPPLKPPPNPPGRVWLPDDEGYWEECNTCDQCTLSPPPTREPPPGWRWNGVVAQKHCRRCYGCNVILSRLPEKEDFQGRPKKVFTGASGTAVMVGHILDGQGREKEVIVKVWCGLKGGYRHTELHEKIPEHCPVLSDSSKCPMTGGMFGQGPCNQMFQNALMSIIDDAGLSHVTPRTWSGHAKSFIPASAPWGGARQRVDTVVQYYDKATGVAVEALAQGVANKETTTALNNANPDQVIAAATFDLLFSERDRHGQNVFIDKDGGLQLIDNEGIYGPINSMFFPGNQKFEIYRLGYNAVCCGNLPGGPHKPGNCPGRPLQPSVETFLDYRCFVAGGKIGFNFPPGVLPFLKKIAKFTPPQIQNMYRLTHLAHAQVVKIRTKDMLEVGFEGAMERAYTRQPKGDGIQYGFNFSYPIHPPCCNVQTCNVRNRQGI